MELREALRQISDFRQQLAQSEVFRGYRSMTVGFSGILASLAAHAGGLLFNDLKQHCSLTDGNLSRHLAVLSDAGLVEIWKGTTGPRPTTMYRLTASGRQRFAEYISVLEKVVADAQSETQAAARVQNFSGGWSPA